MSISHVKEVLNENSAKWMSLPGIVGTGIGELEGKLYIKVLVVQNNPELREKIPREIEGIKVIIEERGMIGPMTP